MVLSPKSPMPWPLMYPIIRQAFAPVADKSLNGPVFSLAQRTQCLFSQKKLKCGLT